MVTPHWVVCSPDGGTYLSSCVGMILWSWWIQNPEDPLEAVAPSPKKAT